MKTCALPLLLLALASGCNRYYYKPNAVNTPLFTAAGQAHVALGGSFSNGTEYNDGNDYRWSSSFFNAQAAVSPLNHLALLIDYSTYNYFTNHPDTLGNVNAHAHLLEGAIGGYYAVGKKVKMVTDCFMGYGEGPVRSDIDMHISRFFIQPGIGMHSDVVDLAFNLRISSVSFNHFSANGRSPYYLETHGLADSLGGPGISGPSYVFMEPAFTLRTGYRFVKIQMQVVFAQSANLVPFQYNGATYTCSLYLSLEDAFRMNNKK